VKNCILTISKPPQTFNGMDLQSFLHENLPELPEDAMYRLQTAYKLSEYLAGVLTGDPPAIKLFDQAVDEATSQLDNDKQIKRIPGAVANLLCNELFALVRDDAGDDEASVKHSKVDGRQLGEVAALFVEGTISNTMAKQLLNVLYKEEVGKLPRDVAQERGFELMTNREELKQLCLQVIDESPKEMERYQLGEKYARKITKYLLGKAMSKSRGNAHPERLREVLEEVLEDVT